MMSIMTNAHLTTCKHNGTEIIITYYVDNACFVDISLTTSSLKKTFSSQDDMLIRHFTDKLFHCKRHFADKTVR